MHKVGSRADTEWARSRSKTNPNNKEVDALAKTSAAGAHKEPLARVRVRRKLSGNIEVRGSIDLHGQQTTIRIITDSYLRTQGLYVYKYEVLSRGPNKNLVDRIYSEHAMAAGHKYSVRVNSDAGQPRVVKVFREID